MLVYDCLTDNQQYGFNAYAPRAGPQTSPSSTTRSPATTPTTGKSQPGCGCTGGGKFWEVEGAVVTDNWVHDNRSVGLWADTNNPGFHITGNYISDNYADGLIYEISYNAQIPATPSSERCRRRPSDPGFPTGAIYVSESGGDAGCRASSAASLQHHGNTFINNWGGVILWENANRFCDSPANTSSGYCTLVNPGKVTPKSCNSANISKAPFLGDCRWKTQNVSVSHNVFDFNAAAVSPACSAATGCGYQGIFSEYGTYPSWSPYQNTTVEQAIRTTRTITFPTTPTTARGSS